MLPEVSKTQATRSFGHAAGGLSSWDASGQQGWWLTVPETFSTPKLPPGAGETGAGPWEGLPTSEHGRWPSCKKGTVASTLEHFE